MTRTRAGKCTMPVETAGPNLSDLPLQCPPAPSGDRIAGFLDHRRCRAADRTPARHLVRPTHVRCCGGQPATTPAGRSLDIETPESAPGSLEVSSSFRRR